MKRGRFRKEICPVVCVFSPNLSKIGQKCSKSLQNTRKVYIIDYTFIIYTLRVYYYWIYSEFDSVYNISIRS